jgi:hypothetical protein
VKLEGINHRRCFECVSVVCIVFCASASGMGRRGATERLRERRPQVDLELISSASPRSQHKSTCTKSRRPPSFPLSLSPMREGVCVCMSIDCARMVHVVEGVVRGGVAGCKCAPSPRHVAPSAPPGARANSRPQSVFGAAQKGWRSTRQSTCGCQCQ